MHSVFPPLTAATMLLPSGLNAAEVTNPALPVRSTANDRPVAASNTRTVPSPHVVTTLLPSGLNAARPGDEQAVIEVTTRSWRASQTSTTPSTEAVANSLPLVLKLTSLRP